MPTVLDFTQHYFQLIDFFFPLTFFFFTPRSAQTLSKWTSGSRTTSQVSHPSMQLTQHNTRSITCTTCCFKKKTKKKKRVPQRMVQLLVDTAQQLQPQKTSAAEKPMLFSQCNFSNSWAMYWYVATREWLGYFRNLGQTTNLSWLLLPLLIIYASDQREADSQTCNIHSMLQKKYIFQNMSHLHVTSMFSHPGLVISECCVCMVLYCVVVVQMCQKYITGIRSQSLHDVSLRTYSLAKLFHWDEWH